MSQTPMLAVRSILLAAPSLCCSLHRTAAAPFAAVTSWKKLINSRLVFLHLLQQRMELLPPCSRAHTHTHAQTPQDTHGANAGQCSTLPTWALVMLAKVQREDWMSQQMGTAFGFPCWMQSQNANPCPSPVPPILAKEPCPFPDCFKISLKCLFPFNSKIQDHQSF